jgi:uncharacterized membrane protein YkgB
VAQWLGLQNLSSGVRIPSVPPLLMKRFTSTSFLKSILCTFSLILLLIALDLFLYVKFEKSIVNAIVFNLELHGYDFFKRRHISFQTYQQQFANSSPTNPEAVQQMAKNATLCFKTSDCIKNTNELLDCGVLPLSNRYYCESNHCINLFVSCSNDSYLVCEKNTCVERTLPIKNPNYVFRPRFWDRITVLRQVRNL